MSQLLNTTSGTTGTTKTRLSLSLLVGEVRAGARQRTRTKNKVQRTFSATLIPLLRVSRDTSAVAGQQHNSSNNNSWRGIINTSLETHKAATSRHTAQKMSAELSSAVAMTCQSLWPHFSFQCFICPPVLLRCCSVTCECWMPWPSSAIRLGGMAQYLRWPLK